MKSKNMVIRMSVCGLIIFIITIAQTPAKIAYALNQSDVTTSETIIVPFAKGTVGVETSRSYSGKVTVTISGSGRAAGTQRSDAFYIYTNSSGKPTTPSHPTVLYNWSLWINGGPADKFLQSIPPYSASHTYTFTFNAPGGKLHFGVGDTTIKDNTGSYKITLSSVSDKSPASCSTLNLTPEECANNGANEYSLFSKVTYIGPKTSECSHDNGTTKIEFLFYSENRLLMTYADKTTVELNRGDQNTFSGNRIQPDDKVFHTITLTFNDHGFDMDESTYSGSKSYYGVSDNYLICTWLDNYTLIGSEPLPNPAEPPVEPKKVTITGHVTDGFTHPLADLKIQIVNAQQAEMPDNVFTKQDGSYEWSGDLPVGTYEVKAWLEDENGRKKVLYGAQQLPVWAGRPLNIVAGQDQYQVDIDFGTQRSDFTSSIQEQDRLDDLAIMYFHVSEVDDFVRAQMPNVAYHPVQSIVGWANGGTRYEIAPEQILIDSSNSDFHSANRPMNREWHEAFHHLMKIVDVSVYQVDPTDPQPSYDPHGGWNNQITRASWAEGWATFWSCVKGNTAQYADINNIEKNIKAWDFSGPYSREDLAIASLLWDLRDGWDDGDQDHIDLSDAELVRLLTNSGNNPPRNQQLRTLNELYNHLSAAVDQGLTNEGGQGPVTQPQLAEIFIAHGFFADAEWNQNPITGFGKYRTWNSGEVPGFGGKPGRRHTPYVPGAYLQIDLETLEQFVQPAFAQVTFLYPEKNYTFSYKQSITTLPALVYVEPIPNDTLALIEIQITTGRGITETFIVDSQTYLQELDKSKGEFVKSVTLGEKAEPTSITGLKIIQPEKVYPISQYRFAAIIETGIANAFLWDFGDGATATGQLTNHVYTIPGDYTVTVTASNSIGTATQTKTITVAKNETTSPSPFGWIQENIIWVIVPVIAVSLMGFFAIFILMKRRKFAFATIGAKPRKPLSKQTAPVNRISAVSAPPIQQPVAASASEQQIKAAQNLAKAGKFQESFTILKEVVAVEPNNAQVWLFLGGNLMNLNDYVNAEKCLQHAQQLGHPKADQALEWLRTKRDG